ncbi:hypothetical protein TNCV_4298241 [Trichonephila clavipes]|nr:hypothetical protein TNCV_4298241 [Trichonephila clavipes]
MDLRFSGALEKFDVFNECKIMVYPTTLPVSNSRMPSAMFPDTTANEFFHFSTVSGFLTQLPYNAFLYPAILCSGFEQNSVGKSLVWRFVSVEAQKSPCFVMKFVGDSVEHAPGKLFEPWLRLLEDCGF